MERAAELVEEFRRETGIASAVTSESNKIELPRFSLTRCYASLLKRLRMFGSTAERAKCSSTSHQGRSMELSD